MKKFTLLFSLLLTFCGAVKAQTTTQVTVADLTEANNRMVYYIKTQDNAVRGALYTPFNGETPIGKLASCGATAANYGAYKSVSMDPLDQKQQYSIITYRDRKYLYSVAARMFSYRGADGGKWCAMLSTDPTKIQFVTVTTVNSYLQIKYRDQNKLNFSNNPNGWNAIFTNYESDDNGNHLVISKVKENENSEYIQLSEDDYDYALNILRKVYLNSLVARADSLITNNTDVVGYPTTAVRNVLATAKDGAAALVADADATVTEDKITEMQTAIDTYYGATDVYLPMDGQAYKIKALYNGGSYRYIKYDETVNRLNVSTTEPTDNSGVFICKHLSDGNVVLVNPVAGYMVYIADGKYSPSGSRTGFVTSYNSQDVSISLCHQKNQNLNGNTNLTKTVFGSLSMQIQARQGGKYYLMAGDANFHSQNPNTLAFNATRSSFFYFEEVDYPACHKPTLNAATGIGDGSKSIATFSAVVPTVVPEGVQAYTVNTDENPAFAKATLLAEAGDAIPASTGVILYGENVGQVTMVPATTTEVAAVEGVNQLLGTAGVDRTAKPATGTSLLLGMKDNVVAFYGWNAGTNLGMNKAYLQLAEGQDASTVRLNFDTATTGIKDVETVGGKSVIFDLSGRRVMNPVKGGIYIRNGKKVIL